MGELFAAELAMLLAAGGLIGCRCTSQRTTGEEQPHSSGIKQTIRRMDHLPWYIEHSGTQVSPAPSQRLDAGAGPDDRGAQSLPSG